MTFEQVLGGLRPYFQKREGPTNLFGACDGGLRTLKVSVVCDGRQAGYAEANTTVAFAKAGWERASRCSSETNTGPTLAFQREKCKREHRKHSGLPNQCWPFPSTYRELFNISGDSVMPLEGISRWLTASLWEKPARGRNAPKHRGRSPFGPRIRGIGRSRNVLLMCRGKTLDFA